MIQLAIDGPSGSGKSTLAKKLANRLNITYLDTGAMYRALTLYVLNSGIDATDHEQVIRLLKTFNLDIEVDKILLDNIDISAEIRKEYISENVSEVAGIKEVREYMVIRQQTIGNQRSIVIDGRDIGTVVLPNATHKFYLTATAEIRAKRRYDEQVKRGYNITYEAILEAIIKRDEYDQNREHSPLRPADDAVIIDTTDLTIEQVVDQILERIEND